MEGKDRADQWKETRTEEGRLASYISNDERKMKGGTVHATGRTRERELGQKWSKE